MHFPIKGGFQKKLSDPMKILYTETSSVERLSDRLVHYFTESALDRHILVVCIGTDRSTGDSLGPLVGSRLQQLGYPVNRLYGTLDEPVHAMNLVDVMHRIHQQHDDPFIIAVDACLGQTTSVGHIQLGSGPVKPGAGVNKDLPPVGDIHLTGIVNVGGFMEYFVLQNTRLSIVFNMAEVIADALYQANLQARRSTPSTLVKLE